MDRGLFIGDIAAEHNFAAQFEIGQFDIDDQAAHQPRAHALIDGVKLRRRHVGGHDDLALLASTRELKVWQNSCCMVLPCRNWKSSISRTSIGLELVLEGDRVALSQRLDEMYMKRSAVMNSTLRSG